MMLYYLIVFFTETNILSYTVFLLVQGMKLKGLCEWDTIFILLLSLIVEDYADRAYILQSTSNSNSTVLQYLLKVNLVYYT